VSRRTLDPLALMLFLPPLTYYFWICLHDHGGALVAPSLHELAARVPPPTSRALALYGGWLLLQISLQLWAPGRVQTGVPLADGSRLPYRLNGWASFWVSIAVALVAVVTGVIPPGVAFDEFGPLLTTANLVAFALALRLYVQGRRAKATTGDPVRDYFMGTTLNPRVREFDLKYFCESRPGLILWVLFDLSLAAAQYERHGIVTTAMLLVNAFQFLYVADYFFHEEAILTTWDIKHEKFGWMLAWGDLVWVPFAYTIQAYYLVDHPHALSTAATGGIVLLNLVGYAVFRASNIQKHRFRRDPSRPVWRRPPEYIRTAAGSLLLTSGWWGIARHLNYLGDLAMALAWCLPTGFAHPLAYVYFVYMIVLLVHRERRDHVACRAKYGADWDAYCRKVRWRIVPGVY
jgi:protein-S-isoprenylcysteine O-methyltransferase Ste14